MQTRTEFKTNYRNLIKWTWQARWFHFADNLSIDPKVKIKRHLRKCKFRYSTGNVKCWIWTMRPQCFVEIWCTSYKIKWWKRACISFRNIFLGNPRSCYQSDWYSSLPSFAWKLKERKLCSLFAMNLIPEISSLSNLSFFSAFFKSLLKTI